MLTQFITAGDGIRIAYDVSGDGPSLMLLHGAGKTRRDWHKVGYVNRLKDDFKVINVDIRGSGESEILTRIEDYDIEKIINDLSEVQDSCGVQQMMVWGYSFGGNIARYLGAWSDCVQAIAVIGVPFGRAVNKDFDGYIDVFIEKYSAQAQAYEEGKLSEKKRKSAIKGRIPVWVPCFQAMRSWPSVDASEVKCPVLLLAGSKNKSVMDWIEEDNISLDGTDTQVKIVDGLTHQQEFSQIDKVFPIVSSFLKNELKVK